MDKLKKWLDLAQQYQSDQFWKQIFDEKNGKIIENNATASNPFTAAQEYIPKCDLYESMDELILEVEIPGLKKEDIQISINHQILTITGEFKSFKTNYKYFLKERANRKFKKELTLPFPILLNSTRSELSSGILMIKMQINRDEIENVPIYFDNPTSE
ncbi:Hsp20/alpha crystallin family protein [Neobacillus sp. PS3-40]|jgi:HSP20 family protein|uniref:Hsp20/alpha crystallin family protein n=1 Tax=Neobacillus sp. PS3-40 TaxID=3070679 RepID=UPI0027DFA738|nr:Hsp20/alpha crystallin family protein [Neobacillus sp. PS3-40]WML46386.1 Hsp20/alpha crystallin family protein [Neobacillus sp. PS3-40]